MIELLQIIKRMLVVLEYHETEIIEAFECVEYNEYTIPELCDSIGIEPTNSQLINIEASFPNWRSALAITQMKLE